MNDSSLSYINWIIEEKGIGKKSAHDYESRLKRVLQLLKNREINADTLTELEKMETFTVLSVSVKSQLRRAVKLYLEYKER